MLYVSVLSCLHSQTSPFGHSIADASPDQLLFIADTLSQILFITDASLIRAPLHYGQSICYGHLSFLDTSLLQTLSITDTLLSWSLLRTPVLCENLSVTDSFMEISLLRTPLYCKYPYLWYGHVFITDTSQSLLQTPINCRHL